MIKYISLLIVAVFLAQAFIAALAVYRVQLSNEKINYQQALQLYFKANMARYVLVAVCVLILSFILSDYMDLSLTREDLRAKGIEALNRVERIQLYFKSYAIGVGAFIEVLAVVLYKAGFKSIIDFGKSKGLTDQEAKTI
ncbi:MAG: hypothetical protein IAE96_04760 [Chitinophagaceae bacterium]|nr:hypothetical protein [Chitinophagaceae bacterium]